MGMPAPRHLKQPPAPEPTRRTGRPRRRLGRMVATAVALTLLASGITVVSAGATNHGSRRPGFGLLPALVFRHHDRQASGQRQEAVRPQPSAPATSATTSSPAPNAGVRGGQGGGGGALKEASSGLILTSPNGLRQYPFIDDITIQSSGWADLEPRPGAYDFSPIDRVLQAHPEAKARLRIYAGFRAPRWLDGVAGACVPIAGGVSGRSGCVPRFWTDAYLDRFERLMTALAQRYEANPHVVGVINSACSTVFAEPFILGIGSDRASAQRLGAAGLNEASHRNCLERSTAAMARVFGSTRIVLDGHTRWQLVTSDGRRADSWEKERDLLNDLRARYGAKLVVEDHGLGPADNCTPGQSLAAASSWYCWLASVPAPKGFQFTLLGGSMSAAADNGVGMRACFLEFAGFTKIDARTVNARLEGNPGC